MKMEILLILLFLNARPVAVAQPKVEPTEQHCLASNIYYEARGESPQGKKAVAQVTLNRVKSKKYPKTICAVVMQKSQFSWVQQIPKAHKQRALNGLPPSQKPTEMQAYHDAQTIAQIALKQDLKVLPSNVLWYHTNSVNPSWNKQMIKVNQIGAHVFYQHKQEGKI